MKKTSILIFVAFALVGCATSSSSNDEQATDRGSLDSQTAELGRIYRATDGSATYATELQLRAGGAFAASLNRELLGGAPCEAGACTVAAAGRWTAHWDELTVDVEPVEGVADAASTLKFRYRVEGGLFRTLILDGLSHPRGVQRFDESKEAISGCVVTRCAAGMRCVESEDRQATCVPTE